MWPLAMRMSMLAHTPALTDTHDRATHLALAQRRPAVGLPDLVSSAHAGPRAASRCWRSHAACTAASVGAACV
jgi:hypothetical protein